MGFLKTVVLPPAVALLVAIPTISALQFFGVFDGLSDGIGGLVGIGVGAVGLLAGFTVQERLMR